MQTDPCQVKPGFQVAPHWSGYLFIFGKKPGDDYPDRVGFRLLLTCILLEAVFRPVLRDAIQWRGPSTQVWRGLALVSAMFLLALTLTRYWVRIPFQRLGLSRWRHLGEC